MTWDVAVIETRDHSGFTPLHCACQRNQLKTVKAFELQLEHEALREAKTHDSEFNTPLHIACRNGDTCLEIVKFLIQKDANVNATNRNGETPIHISASNGFTKLAEELLRAEVDVDVQDVWGCTPLTRAIISNQDMVVSLLLPRYVIVCCELKYITGYITIHPNQIKFKEGCSQCKYARTE